MKRPRNHVDYSSDPHKLINVLDGLIKKQIVKKPSERQSQKAVQFIEISKTVERLQEAGTEVPAELRRLKLELSHQAAEYEKTLAAYQSAVNLLKGLEMRLGNSLTLARATLTRLTGKGNSRPKTRRYVKRTSPKILAKELRKALHELGGAAKKGEVLDKIRQNMEGRFKPQDLEKDTRGNPNWERWAVAEKVKMTKKGIIKASSSFGIWELMKR